MRLPWWGKLGLLAILSLSVLTGAGWATSLARTPTANKTVVIYFYPNDYQADQTYVGQIDPAVGAVRQWYADQVGATFTADGVITVRGSGDSAWYKCNKTDCGWAAVWTNVLLDLQSKGYWFCGDTTYMIFVHSSIPFTGGGSCDPAYTADRGGVAMWTETVFDQMLGLPPPLGSEWCWTPDCSLGAVAHELGHSFSLPHLDCGGAVSWDDCARSVMFAWWSYPNVGLLDLGVAPEKRTLANSPFFSGSASSSATPTSSPSPSPTPTPSESSSASSTFSATATPKPSPTPTPTPSAPDTLAPAVTIVKPANQSLVRGRWLQVAAAASDNVGVVEVQLYIDSQLVLTTTAANLDYAWDTLRVARGTSIKVTARALDGAGNSSAAEVTVAK